LLMLLCCKNKKKNRVLPREIITVTAQALATPSKYLSKESITGHI
jgi:hypothetical protein